MSEEVVGFTKKQIDFFKEIYGYRCTFHYKNGVWRRCENVDHLELHHIYPRGWCRVNMPKTFEVNGLANGIILCRGCHQKVHPDVPVTLMNYRAGNKNAFDEMMDARRKLNKAGIVYWNTEWDLEFLALNKRFVAQYLKDNPNAVYPQNRNRGLNGRVKENVHVVGLGNNLPCT